MAVSLVATAGDAAANAYATVEEAESCLEGRTDVPAWTAGTADNKARWLIQAAAEIDSHALYPCPHSLEDSDCPLHFPTPDCEDDSGAVCIPTEVRDASAILAAHIATHSSGQTAQLGALAAQGVTGMTEGRVSVSLRGGSQGQASASIKDPPALAWATCAEARKLLATKTEFNDYKGWLIREATYLNTL